MIFFVTRRVAGVTFYWDAVRGAFSANPAAGTSYRSGYVAACVASVLNANVVRFTPAPEIPANRLDNGGA